jgi:hypothetical protein
MPLYLVRWPGLEASIVRADDEDHLTALLDEVASPTEATWTEYEGPLWVDVSFGLDAKHEEEGRAWTVVGADKATKQPWLGATVQTGDSETADEMIGAVIAAAFPNLSTVIEEADDEQLDLEKVDAAALRDLAEHAPSGVTPASLRELEKVRVPTRNGGG